MEQSFSDNIAGADPVYTRELPGGGYVAIEVKREPQTARIRLSVERRAKSERRDGHDPIVIAETDGDERSPGFAELYQMAADNAAIARKLLEIGAPQRAD